MTMLVTLAQAKAHLRVITDAEDDDITLKIHAASALVIDYLKEAADTFTDSSGEVLLDSSDLPETPYAVKAATLLMVGDLFKNREPTPDDVVNTQFGYGYLPRAVVALLYPLRDPSLA
jgi:hypothetical protein